jgi:hypothetical protein
VEGEKGFKTMKWPSLALCLAVLSTLLVAQNDRTILTNADVINMTKSGMGDKTVVLVIQQSPTKFDTRPEALIELKKAGISDEVVNAMLLALPAPGSLATESTARDGRELFEKALNATGATERIATVHSLQVKFVRTPAGATPFQGERIVLYPDKAYVSLRKPDGTVNKVVVTPDFNYQVTGKMATTVPATVLDDIRAGIKTESVYVAQHRGEYTCVLDGREEIGGIEATKLRIKGNGTEFEWSIEPLSGRLLRFRSSLFGDTTTDYSDWRQVDGLTVAFKRHVVENGRSSDIVVSSMEINPTIDEALFSAPSQNVAIGLTFKVLQSESVPYVVETSGGISTNCQISGSTSTTMSAYTSGNMTFGNATSTPDLRMNCNTSADSFRWTHVLNAMLVEASDGNAYIIACDAAWRWSKCTGLKPGDIFNARRGDKGFVVQFFNTKQQEKEATYTVLQAKALR